MAEKEILNLFISYSHKDKDIYLPELLSYLESKSLSDFISIWYDKNITAGSEWNDNIKTNLDKADIIVLLISQDFLRSEYIDKIELKNSIQRHNKGECAVIPLFIRHCILDGYEDIMKLQGLPRDKTFISDMEIGKDKAYSEIQLEIKNKAIEILAKKRERRNRSAGSNETVAKLQDQPASSQDIIQESKPTENNNDIYAVIIANYQFSNLVNKNIQNVKVNLLQLENTFRKILKLTNVFTFDNEDSSSVSKELEKIIRKCPIESTLLLYYSGHGLIESNEFYWASEDTELNPEDNNRLVTASAISAEYVKKLLEKDCKAKHKVLISDCCYSNAFLNNSLSVNHNTFIKQKFAIRDTYYFFSSSENEVSLYPISEPNRPTYFTEAFLTALKTGVEPNYEYCSLGQIINLTQKELNRLRGENSGIPEPIKPDDDPKEEIRLCSNPNYVRRSEQKKLSEVIENTTNKDLTQWIRFHRNDSDIEIGIGTLIARHKYKFNVTKDFSHEEDKDLIDLIKLLELALQNKNDVENFNETIQLYVKKSTEISDSQKQTSDNSINNKALPPENESLSENRLIAESSKAEKGENKFKPNNTDDQNDGRRSQPQFKRPN